MRFTALLVAAGAGIAAAQSSAAAAPAANPSTTPSGCGTAIDAIIKACLANVVPGLKLCAVQDWGCLCRQETNVLSCYDSCQSAPDRFGVQSSVNSYCSAAKSQPSSSAVAGPKGKETPTPASSSSGGSNVAHTGFAEGSGNPSASAEANAAAGLGPASGLIAAFFGLALL